MQTATAIDERLASPNLIILDAAAEGRRRVNGSVTRPRAPLFRELRVQTSVRRHQ